MSSDNATTADEVFGRIIKKYPNRRLYDTSSSSYIALADIKELVMRHTPFVVRDAKTGEDLTRSLLLQIILEEEAAGAPILTERVLANIIRFYGHTLQGYMGTYLEKNVQSFIDMQMQLTEQSVPSAMSNWMALQEQLQDQMKNNLQQQTDHMLRVMGLKKS
jgi:polyhydroxyalkanoate synthesis repressor PhaR